MPRRIEVRSSLKYLWLLLAIPAIARAGTWTPNAWQASDTIELRTNCPAEGEHWFPVWLVVLDGEVYVRLGSKAASRIECNSSKNTLAVRIAGQEFSRVLATSVPDASDRVAAGMREKYWTDIFVRYLPHPLTLRLKPE